MNNYDHTITEVINGDDFYKYYNDWMKEQKKMKNPFYRLFKRIFKRWH